MCSPRCSMLLTFSLHLKKTGLADEHGDVEEAVEEIHVEKPLAVNTKPFVVRKFRDALRRKDCITG